MFSFSFHYAGDINVDHEVYAELQKTGHFRAMDPAVDEVITITVSLQWKYKCSVKCAETGIVNMKCPDPRVALKSVSFYKLWCGWMTRHQAEHSLELHMPFIAHVFRYGCIDTF